MARAAGAMAGLAAVAALGACGDAPSTPKQLTTRIVFTTIDSVTSAGVTWSVAPDGSSLARLSDPARNEVTPSLSPDGARLVVVSATTAQPGVPQIFVGAVGGATRAQLTSSTAGATSPSWTPDGRQVLYFNRDDVKAWLVGADGSGPHPVSSEIFDEFTPVMSPDGRRIAFASGRYSNSQRLLFELFVMDADGSNVRRLTTSTPAYQAFNMYPAWSPDGTRLAFVRWVDDSAAHIWTVNPDGTGARQLVPGTQSDRSVAWSPDGRMIAFARSIDRLGDIFVANADGSGIRNVTNSPRSDDQYPSWGVMK